jgi:hypothetical protein
MQNLRKKTCPAYAPSPLSTGPNTLRVAMLFGGLERSDNQNGIRAGEPDLRGEPAAREPKRGSST